MDFNAKTGIKKQRNTRVMYDEEDKENLWEIHQVIPTETSKNVRNSIRKSERPRRFISVYDNDFVFDNYFIKILTSHSRPQSPPRSNDKSVNVHQLMDVTRAIGEQLVQNRGEINSSTMKDLSSLLQLSVNDNCQPLRKKLKKGKINDQLENSSKCSLPAVLSDVNPPYNDKNVPRTNWYSRRNAYLTLLSEIQDSLSDSSTTYPSSSSLSSAHNSLDGCVQNSTSSCLVSKDVVTAQEKALHKLEPNIMGYRWSSKEEAYGTSSTDTGVEALLSWK
ncbi:unnamed protein product [Trichobilharzia szidati]|nr:unnamed protein product [Trichobilharzia szidati]